MAFTLLPTAERTLRKRIPIYTAANFPALLSSDVEYFLDGRIDVSNIDLIVPAGGAFFAGHNFDLSGLYTNKVGHSIFTSAVGGSGNMLFRDVSFSALAASSKVFDLTGATGNEAIELDKCNFNDCVSLGTITNYRQYLEVGTGRFGGTPELTLDGAFGGARISTSIVRGLSNLTALFKSGAGLTFSGRFITDINCDLPTVGALTDFAPANFTNDESLVIQGAYITRNFAVDPADAAITPNITSESVKSSWSDNTGLPNTSKYLKAVVTAEALTTVSSANTYYPLLGTFTVDKQTHFDMPTNGQFRLLTGQGDYRFSGDVIIVGNNGDVIDIRVTKSSDGGSTFPTQISHIKRVINNLSGPRDVAFFPVNFVANLAKNDRVRIEVENKTAVFNFTNNVTMELDSSFIISQL